MEAVTFKVSHAGNIGSAVVLQFRTSSFVVYFTLLLQTLLSRITAHLHSFVPPFPDCGTNFHVFFNLVGGRVAVGRHFVASGDGCWYLRGLVEEFALLKQGLCRWNTLTWKRRRIEEKEPFGELFLDLSVEVRPTPFHGLLLG